MINQKDLVTESIVNDIIEVLLKHNIEERTGIPNTILANSMWNNAVNSTGLVAALFEFIREANAQRME
jgi:hypothetical protein